MQNGVPGVLGRVQWFACVCELCCGVCVPAFTDIMSAHRFLWLRRHKQLKQSQMITLITHEHRKLERKERDGGGGGGWRSGKAAERVEGRVEDENVCASVCLCA